MDWVDRNSKTKAPQVFLDVPAAGTTAGQHARKESLGQHLTLSSLNSRDPCQCPSLWHIVTTTDAGLVPCADFGITLQRSPCVQCCVGVVASSGTRRILLWRPSWVDPIQRQSCDVGCCSHCLWLARGYDASQLISLRRGIGQTAPWVFFDESSQNSLHKKYDERSSTSSRLTVGEMAVNKIELRHRIRWGKAAKSHYFRIRVSMMENNRMWCRGTMLTPPSTTKHKCWP